MSNAENNERQSSRRRRRGGKSPREPRPPRLFNVVEIRFDTNFMRHDFNVQELHVRKGDRVVVDTERGPILATAVSHPQRKMLSPDGLESVLRVALEQDVSQAERNTERERESYRFALERIRARKLPMKLVRAQYMLDGSKIIFYFSAEGRIDFRDLVKDLAHKFRTRIEMHQIGARDGARMLGGIGPCGRELCCSTFLEEFAPVSIRMAKDQGLTLNPKKVSGMCGRLMCCLVYEQQVYKRMRRALPRPGKLVRTEAGVSKVLSVDVINQRVTVELPDTNRRTLHVSEIAPHDPDAEVTARVIPKVKYLWDDVLPDEPPRKAPPTLEIEPEAEGTSRRSRGARRRAAEAPSGDRSKRRRRSRRRRKDSETTPSTDPSTQPKPSEATPVDASGQTERKRRRRRRRGGRRGDKSGEATGDKAKKGGKDKGGAPDGGSDS